LDFADVRSVLAGGGVALVGLGEASGVSDGSDRIETAVKNALYSPLLGDLSVKGATGALIHVIGGPDLSLDEATRVAQIITRQMRHDARIIWGARVLPDFTGYVRVLLIVTGLEGNSAVLPGFSGNPSILEGINWDTLNLYRIDKCVEDNPAYKEKPLAKLSTFPPPLGNLSQYELATSSFHQSHPNYPIESAES